MPHHISFIEVGELDALGSFEDTLSVIETRDLTGREVNLSHISSHYHLAMEAHSSHEHFHLLHGTVLGLIQYDKAVAQRASPHESEGSDFDEVLIQQLLNPGRVEQEEKRII